jgi:Pyruvate/2-oxoacid:ferredoxin oxidoreductase delta subunit
MCQFCVEHGDGEKWYLQAANYAHDLTTDLERRRYMIEFVRDFDRNRAKSLVGLEALNAAPASVRAYGRQQVTRRMAPNHFGQPVPIEDCERILDITTSVVRLPCVCRRSAGRGDRAYCLAITTRPVDDVLEEAFSSYEDGPDVSAFERLDKEETLALLRDFEDEGLMHSVWTFKTPFIAAICNCDLASGCMAMRITREFEAPIMWHGEYVARADHERCTGCKRCVGQCPFEAFDWDELAKRPAPSYDRCYGCGVCRAVCEEGALSLVERESAKDAAGSHAPSLARA